MNDVTNDALRAIVDAFQKHKLVSVHEFNHRRTVAVDVNYRTDYRRFIVNIFVAEQFEHLESDENLWTFAPMTF